jgi:hypothetical protein
MSRSTYRSGATKTSTKTRGARGSGPARRPYAWLGAGAVGVGVGVWAALAGGAAVAHAEGPAADSSGSGSTVRDVSATADNGVARRSSRAAASRVAGKAPVPSVGVSGSRPAAAPTLLRARWRRR